MNEQTKQASSLERASAGQGDKGEKGRARATVRPRVDVFENDAEFLVVADMPGVAADAVDVRFEGGELYLEGRRSPPPTGKSLVLETSGADFQRSFAMPDGIDASKIEAKHTAGVLTVHLPKSDAKRPRRIEVRAR